MLEEIRTELESTESNRLIPKQRVLEWMRNGDSDVLGATYGLIHSIHRRRIRPELTSDECFDFLLHYYEFCLVTDPKSEWASSRYSAGWDLVGWFVQLWKVSADRKRARNVQLLLERLYRTGDAELKKCLEHAILEHLFENRGIRKFFEYWKSDRDLKPAYDEAMLWVSGGGSSPLNSDAD